jgi:Fic family protein
VIETAEKGIKTFDSILKLQKQVDLDLLTLGRRSVNAQKIMAYLYNKPLLNAEKVNEVAGISYPSTYKLIGDLERLGILKEITGGRRSREYIFEKYINLFQ